LPVAGLDDLRQSYLFRSFDDAQLAELLARSRSHRLRHDEWLLRQDEPATSFFVVRRGRLALLRSSEAGQEKVVAVLDPLETFAEGAACLPEPVYPLGARAVGTAEVLAFDLALLRRILQHSVELCWKVLAVAQRRERYLLDEIDRLTLHNASQRVVAYLLAKTDHATAGRVVLDLPKGLLASQLSITPETLSRILARLKEQGMVVEDEPGSLVVVDPHRLRIEYRCFLCGGRSWGCAGPVLT
jgi:CRP-like cAMP-binding protein